MIAADTTLNIPDYRSEERTFQLVTQVAGRAGRGDERGKVIIQTYEPDNYALTSAASNDYEGFFEQESRIRSFLVSVCSCEPVALLKVLLSIYEPAYYTRLPFHSKYMVLTCKVTVSKSVSKKQKTLLI